MRIAYVTPEACGLGHAVRGVALVQAAQRAGIDLRAFGPPVKIPDPEYEGSTDWQDRVHEYRPDLLLGDIAWVSLEALRESLGVPAWLLLRWMQPGYLRAGSEVWERRIAIEPIAVQERVTHQVHPITVAEPRTDPPETCQAGYNAYWEAARFGYRDQVRWTDGGSPERRARIDAGGDPGPNGADELIDMIGPACARCDRPTPAPERVWVFSHRPRTVDADRGISGPGFDPVHLRCPA